MTADTKNVLRPIFIVLGTVAFCACLAALTFASPQAEETSAGGVQSAPTDSTARPDESAGVVEFRMRDVQTGYSVKANVEYDRVQDEWANPISQATDEEGRFRLRLPAGDYLFEVTAPGYKPMRDHHLIQPGTVQRETFALSPTSPPAELRQDVLDAKLRPGFTLVLGYVVDDGTGRPLAGATVRVVEAGVEVKTNQRGYYEISVPSPPGTVIEGAPFPGMGDLIISLKGYRTYVGRNLDFPDDDTAGLNVALVRGRGEIVKDYTHKLRRPSSGKEIPQSTEPEHNPGPQDHRIADWLSVQGGAGLSVGTGTSLQTTAPLALSLPGYITVGSLCVDPYNCITATRYVLEDYVAQGLESEWITSWDANAVKAGAVAYRSYGVWYVANPLCPSIGYDGHPCPRVYDICDYDACQVFTPSHPVKKTKDAVAATAGVVLTSNGSDPYKAEYAERTNTGDGACLDGQTGEHTSDWPCMKDFVCTGEAFAGHGRGMCQYGSQRWATGKDVSGIVVTSPRDWRCILDHYYNASSNSKTVDPNGTGDPGAGSGLRTAFLQGQPTYGSIAYEAQPGADIRVADAADGSHDHSLSLAPPATYPAWEPGGSRLAYTATGGIAIVNADGTGQHLITTNVPGVTRDFGPSWSPLGNKIAFCRAQSSSVDIWMMDPDGLTKEQITQGVFIWPLGATGYELEDCYVRWSPDGTKIAFTGTTAYGQWGGSRWNVYTVQAVHNAPSPIQLTDCHINSPGTQSLCGMPSWSPDGKKIAFADADTPYGDNIGGGGIYTMNPDGTGITPCTRTRMQTTSSPNGPRTDRA